MKLTVTSPAFKAEGTIPARFTCDGEDINPELRIAGIPPETRTLALVMDDPDAPVGTWDHWIVWNLEPERVIEEDSTPPGAVQGRNSWGRNEYGGPCPPSGSHRYFFKVYALDTRLDLPPGAGKKELEQAMKGRILAQGELMGRYSRR